MWFLFCEAATDANYEIIEEPLGAPLPDINTLTLNLSDKLIRAETVVRRVI
jgi:hypothetical protein